jgi:MFS family permease
MSEPTWRAVSMLGLAQTLAWASSYYLPAMLATSIARDLGVAVPTVFAAFSAALVVAALIGPSAGRAIDAWGGRPVLMTTNAVFALGLVGLALAHGPVALFAAWAVLGAGMGAGLYEGAFAALVRLYGSGSRGAITGVTLFGGFASTVGWPLSSWLEAQIGWRDACLAWAALHLVIGLPLNAALPKASAPAADPAAGSIGAAPASGPELGPDEPVAAVPPHARRSTLLLALVFATTLFSGTAMAAHLPRLMLASGTTLATAVFVGALVGPSQVAARLLEFGVLRRMHPLLAARLSTLLHPVGVLLLGLFGAPAAVLFGVLHGAGNGLLTIAKGTLPLAIFGPAGYGRRQGVLSLPARISQASAPWLFGLCLDRWGAHALWLSAGLGVLAFTALLGLPMPHGGGSARRVGQPG